MNQFEGKVKEELIFSDWEDVLMQRTPEATNSLEILLRERYSCRAFLSQPVPELTLKRILRMAQRTPSWCNTQPWHVVVTSGDGTSRFRRALLDQTVRGERSTDFEFPREYTEPFLARRRQCGRQLYESLGIDRRDHDARTEQALRNFHFFDAPHVAIIVSPEPLGVYGAIDCGAFVNNFMLGAKSLGVASVAQAALAVYSSFIREYFKMDDSWRIVCGISFGYADTTHPVNKFRTDRAELEDSISWVSD